LKSTAHTYTRFDQIEALIVDAESRLTSLLKAKKHFTGAVFDATSGASVPNAYKFSRDATCVTLTRKPTGWYLVEAVAAVIYKEGGKKSLRLTAAQDVAACQAVRTQYRVESLSE